MEFINSAPSQKDLKSPKSLVLYFLRTSVTHKTKYKDGWTLHTGANRSWIECVEYCSQFFPKARIERALVRLLENEIYCFRCSDIDREVIVLAGDDDIFDDYYYYNRVCIRGSSSVSSEFARKLAKISGDNGYTE